MKNRLYHGIFLCSIMCLSALFPDRALGSSVKVHSEIEAKGQYDDNLYYSKDKKEQDLIGIISPLVKFQYEQPRLKFVWDTLVNFLGYLENRIENVVTGDINADFDYEVTKNTRLTVANDLKKDYDPARFIGTVRVKGKNDYWRNRFLANVFHDFSEDFSLTTRYSNELFSIDRDSSPQSYENEFFVQIDKGFDRYRSRSYLRYNIERRDFQRAGHASINSAAIGLKQEINRYLTYDMNAGIQFIRKYDGKEYTGPYGAVTITLTPLKTTFVDLGFQVRNDTNGYTQDTFLLEIFRAALRHEFSETTRFTVAGLIARADLRTIERVDLSKKIELTLEHDLDVSTSLKAEYTYEQRDSSDSTIEYAKSLVTLSVNKIFE